MMHLPLEIGDFSDYSCSKEHNLAAGRIVLGIENLPPAFYHYPIGYTGRTSSIAASGTPVQRPWGMYRSSIGDRDVVFAPSEKIDFELEVGCVIGQTVERGEGCLVEKAEDHIFGFVLLNDWSGT